MGNKLLPVVHYSTWRSGLATDHFSTLRAGRLSAVLTTEHQPELGTHVTAHWTVEEATLRGRIDFYFSLTSTYVENKRIIHIFFLLLRHLKNGIWPQDLQPLDPSSDTLRLLQL